ncbi:MAG: DNA alkylation repair protein, partial [Bacteroidota bacterium]
PSETLSLLSEWNVSPNIWEKRASLVAFTRRIASKKIYIEYLLKFSNNLLSENNDLIKKAIGWALKDNLRYSKHEIMNYIDLISKKEGTS